MEPERAKNTAACVLPLHSEVIASVNAPLPAPGALANTLRAAQTLNMRFPRQASASLFVLDEVECNNASSNNDRSRNV